jgi:hypothetical protein
MLTDKQKENIKAILESFNFTRVMKAMDALEWTYVKKDGGKNKYFRPEIKDVMDLAEALMAGACEAVSNGQDQEICAYRCGGFAAAADRDGEVELSFEIENCYSADLNY